MPSTDKHSTLQVGADTKYSAGPALIQLVRGINHAVGVGDTGGGDSFIRGIPSHMQDVTSDASDRALPVDR